MTNSPTGLRRLRGIDALRGVAALGVVLFGTNPGWPQLANVFLVVISATIVFAWAFFWFCEKPFMARRTRELTEPSAVAPGQPFIADVV